MANITLSDEQQQLFSRFELGSSHMFITGKAGTGKSTLLQYIINHTQKKFVVLAPTGVAALNVGGQTIHSFFLLPPTFIEPKSLRLSPKTAAILQHLDTIIIDEVSMVRADLMDAIDHLLRQARDSSQPFGGLQMLLFGDLYQLPPVVSDPELLNYFSLNNGGFYFFNSHAWADTDLEIFELNQNFRQTDTAFSSLLDALRTGDVTADFLDLINERVLPLPLDDHFLTLATTNFTVSEINHLRLSTLTGAEFEFPAVIDGEIEESTFPTDKVLHLKKDARVMLLKNDSKKRWVNGTLATIESVSSRSVQVNINGVVHEVVPETWNKIRYYFNHDHHQIEEEIVSSFTQYPLRLAWAITIHKSQGQTYDQVVIDFGRSTFAHGQAYVALSRCRHLNTLYLKRPLTYRDIIIDPAVISFMSRANISQLLRTNHKI